MSSNYIDGMLSRCQSDQASSSINYNSPSSRFFPYMGLPASCASVVPDSMSPVYGASNNVNDLNNKGCSRYTSPESSTMGNGFLQNSSMTNMAVAAASTFYHSSSSSTNPVSALSSCAQAVVGVLPDVPRYPWMAIT